MKCLKDNCENAPDAVVAALATGSALDGVVGSCAAAKGMAPCSTDLNSMISSLPAGTLLANVCGEECPAECTPVPPPAAPAAPSCAPPADMTDAASLGAYMKCLKDNCENAPDAVVAALATGSALDGVVGSCAAAKGMAPCSTDLNS